MAVLLKIKHVPEQLGDVIGIPVLFTLLFTYLFSGALAGSTHGYLQFLLPGTLALAVVFVTVYSFGTLNADLATGFVDPATMPGWLRGVSTLPGLQHRGRGRGAGDDPCGHPMPRRGSRRWWRHVTLDVPSC